MGTQKPVPFNEGLFSSKYIQKRSKSFSVYISFGFGETIFFSESTQQNVQDVHDFSSHFELCCPTLVVAIISKFTSIFFVSNMSLAIVVDIYYIVN